MFLNHNNLPKTQNHENIKSQVSDFFYLVIGNFFKIFSCCIDVYVCILHNKNQPECHCTGDPYFTYNYFLLISINEKLG